MSNKAIPRIAWFIPLAPITLAFAIYFGQVQSDTFLFINQLTQRLPNTLWAWLTFIGNGWGVFALCFPLLLLAPRLLSAGIFAGAISGIASSILKNCFDLPRPASILAEGSFNQVGEALLFKALPSGHTLTAFSIASALYFSTEQDKRKPLLILFLLATCVGISRNAVGAHWLTDVLAGAGIGLWCGMFGALLATHLSDASLEPKRAWPRFIAIGGLVAIYAHITQVMDLELNQPLQYASIAIITITLVFFGKAQFSQAHSQ